MLWNSISDEIRGSTTVFIFCRKYKFQLVKTSIVTILDSIALIILIELVGMY